jgi:hypothetical protein
MDGLRGASMNDSADDDATVGGRERRQYERFDINPYRPFGDNLNPGMGVRFRELSPELRERIVALVRTVAYLRSDGN